VEGRRAAEAEAARAACEAAASIEAAWRDAAQWRRAAEERERAVCYLRLELEQVQALLTRLACGMDQADLACPAEGIRSAGPAPLSVLARGAGVAAGWPRRVSLPDAPPFAARRSPPPSALPVPRVLCSIAPNTVHDRWRAAATTGTKPKQAAVTPNPRRGMREMRRKLLRVLTQDRDALRIQLETVRQQSAALAAAAP
jgi:hypothetical protein